MLLATNLVFLALPPVALLCFTFLLLWLPAFLVRSFLTKEELEEFSARDEDEKGDESKKVSLLSAAAGRQSLEADFLPPVVLCLDAMFVSPCYKKIWYYKRTKILINNSLASTFILSASVIPSTPVLQEKS